MHFHPHIQLSFRHSFKDHKLQFPTITPSVPPPPPPPPRIRLLYATAPNKKISGGLG